MTGAVHATKALNLLAFLNSLNRGRKDRFSLRYRPTQAHFPPRKIWPQRLGRCCLVVAQVCQPRHGSGVQKLNKRRSETKQLSTPQFARPACAS